MENSPEKLEKIFNDNLSGSKELLAKIHNFLKTEWENLPEPTETLKEIRHRLSSFTAIEEYCTRLEKIIREKGDVENFFTEFEEHQKELPEILLRKLIPYLEGKNTILTISNSKTVADVLIKYFNEKGKIKIIVSESRPQNEGILMAEKFSRAGIPTKLITEAMLGNAAKEADIGIIGADKILADGSVINKVGSFTMAIALKYFSKPLIVLGENSKKSKEIEFHPRYFSPQEILSEEKSMIQITNYYFERVPETLITAIVSD